MTKISESQPSLTEKEVENVVKKLAFEIPIEYREFLQQTNGGIPVPDAVKHEGKYWDNVSCFYSVRNNLCSDDLFRNIEEYKEMLPSHYLPIGESPGGNLYCLSLRSEDFGSVYFWDHDEANYDGEPWEENMTLLASSLPVFINSLYIEN